MTNTPRASVCTIGDEIIIGQIVDTNSSRIASALEGAGVRVERMLSFRDKRETIISLLRKELEENDIVIVTGGLGPTKDDITKDALRELSGSEGYRRDPEQLKIIHSILSSRGLDVLQVNLDQALVPDRCEVIPNTLGTAPVMAFDLGDKGSPRMLYSLPGVPFEAEGAIPKVVDHIKQRFSLPFISHRNVMVYGVAESLLAKKIEAWEDALPASLHLAYLPNPLTGVRLRLSCYEGSKEQQEIILNQEIDKLTKLLGPLVYSLSDDTLQHALGSLLRQRGKTLSAAESCTGGEISHLVTSVPGSSEYYLGSVTSYAVSVKETVLGVDPSVVERFGVVSREVAEQMAAGVRKLTGSDYSVATTGLAGPGGDGVNPPGTVWIAVAGPKGVRSEKKTYRSDRARNIERFAASALDFLRLCILDESIG